MDYRLQKLEKDSIDIIRKAKDKFKNIAVLKSEDKESGVCLHLCKRAFFGKIPFTVLYFSSVGELKEAADKYNLEALIVPAKDFNCGLGSSYLKIYPFSDWQEIDTCLYIKENNIPIDKDTEEALKKLDGQPLKKESDVDKEKEEIMKRLKDLGYM